MGLTREDISLRTDYTAHDQYRLPMINELLLDPLRTIELLLDLEKRFWDLSYNDRLNELIELYGNDTLYEFIGFEQALTQSNELVQLALQQRPFGLDSAFQELTRYSPELTSTIQDQIESERKYDSLVIYLKQNADKIDYLKLFAAARLILYAAQDYAAWIRGLDLENKVIPGIKGTVLYYKTSTFGQIVVGDTGSNIYHGDLAVIIDLGGDDEYYLDEPTNIQMLVDQSGNDIYQSCDYGLGGGHFGISLLWDIAGNDKYNAGNYSIGCGIFGIGMVFDREGNDNYTGESFTQGAAGFGIGLLCDEQGNDVYLCTLHGQGFASTYGVGVLADQKGNDMYLVQAKYPDEGRYLDHYLSLSQGFTIGFRPDLSGGIGLILEHSGNDYYLADIFAQGAAYWYGLGAMIDQDGNDTYVAYQYAQGSGVHVGIGGLLDINGNDNYVAKGVSQGCGHDLAAGLLYDLNGDDSYTAFDLSQGAGNANGMGILIDESGDDVYSAKKTHNTQGFGDLRREYSSIGLLMDIKGNDFYSSGKNAMIWKKGEYGLGIDWE